MWLAWDDAALLAAALALLSHLLRRTARPRMADLAKETAIVMALYSIWQKAGDLAVTGIKGADAKGRWIWHIERVLHLPSEASVQRAVLSHPWLIQALNGFYAVAHVPALVIFLIWLYVRHRDAYARWRNIGAVLTGASLLIQAIPVAPPRLMPDLGFVDTAARYGQSVYGPDGLRSAQQVAAMPSVHVAWAVFIAVAVVCTSTSKWRWLVFAHPLVTTWAIVATANHWWLDGAVSVALLPLAIGVVDGAGVLRPSRPSYVLPNCARVEEEPDRGSDRMPVV